jgi:hypothetical protein
VLFPGINIGTLVQHFGNGGGVEILSFFPKFTSALVARASAESQVAASTRDQ